MLADNPVQTKLICPNHQKEREELCRVCLNDACRLSPLICYTCGNQFHLNHNTKSFIQFFELMDQQFYDTTAISAINQVRNSIKQRRVGNLQLIEKVKEDFHRQIQIWEKSTEQFFEDCTNKLREFEEQYKAKMPDRFIRRNNINEESMINLIQQFQNLTTVKSKIKSKVGQLESALKQQQLNTKQWCQAINSALSQLNTRNTDIKDFNLNITNDKPEQWSETMKQSQIKVQGKVASKNSQTKLQYTYQKNASGVLADAPLAKKGETVQWSIKIRELRGWVAVGVCLSNQIIKIQYTIQRFNYTFGHYLVTSDGLFNISENKQSSNEKFKLKTGDLISFIFDAKSRNLTIKKGDAILKFKVQPQPQGDDYYPCAYLGMLGDSIQFQK